MSAAIAKMHADEPDIDDDLVRRLLAAQFPRWAGLPLKRVASSGTDNAMFRLGDELAVRLPRTAWAVNGITHERRWLPHLAERVGLPIPEPLELGGPGEGYEWPWLVVRWLDGVNPVVGAVREPRRLATDLAAFVTGLRALDPAEGPKAGRGVPLASRDGSTREAIAALEGRIDTAGALAVWEEALRLPEYDGPARWMHGDLSAGNLLLNDDRLSAVIDFSLAGVGDPTVDLVPAWNLLPAEARDTFREAVGADEAGWLRGRALALSIALIQLPYYWDTNPALAANSRHVIGEILG
ncbi:aminoglycoside phosphotransferase family protein [Kitasatospora sp. NPDC004240]